MNTVPVPNDSFNWLLASIEFFIVAKEAFKFEFKFEALNCKAWKTSVTLVACSLDIPKFLPKSVVIWSKSNKALIIPANEAAVINSLTFKVPPISFNFSFCLSVTFNCYSR